MTDKTLFEKHTELFRGDIGLYYCGKRINTQNHVYGPEIRSHFLIVAVENGKAILHGNNGDIDFENGDVLVMFPNEKIYYHAKTSWSIKWLGVSGSLAENVFSSIGITRENPIFSPENFDEILHITDLIYNTDQDGSLKSVCKIQSLLYEFFSLLYSDNNKKSFPDPITSAKKIIEYNYNNDLSVDTIAKSLFLDSAYFSRLFRKKVGISPKKYILELRLYKAKELLKKSEYSIKEIAVTTGFKDPLYFSKLFKDKTGMSPSEYKAYLSLSQSRQSSQSASDISTL